MEEPREYVFSTQSPKQDRLFELTPRDRGYGLVLFLSAILFAAFGLCGGFQAGFTATALLCFGVCTAYLYPGRAHTGVYAPVCGLLACMLSGVFLLTSNGSVRFFSVLVMGLLAAVWFCALAERRPGTGDLGLLGTVCRSLFPGMCGKMPASMASLFAGKGRKKKGLGKALLGVVLALPVLVIVVPLLISSDAAFSGMAEALADNLGSAAKRIIVGLLLAPFLVSFCFALRKTEHQQTPDSNFRGVESTIVVSFLSVLSVCYLAYLFSQMAYFFSAFQGFLPQGYTFSVSEYARRGFFEMTVIAALNFAIVFGALLLSRKQNGKLSMPVRLLSLFISLFTLIIIATALSKMGLYIGSFGMTVLRITTSAFMVFLTVVFISLILRLFIPRVKVVQTALLAAGCVLLVLGCVNVNRVVASYNYDAYKSGALETVDVQTIAELGDEGVPYLVKLAEDRSVSVAIRSQAESELSALIREEYYHTRMENGKHTVYAQQRHISAYSIAAGQAYTALEQYIRNNPDRFVFAR